MFFGMGSIAGTYRKRGPRLPQQRMGCLEPRSCRGWTCTMRCWDHLVAVVGKVAALASMSVPLAVLRGIPHELPRELPRGPLHGAAPRSARGDRGHIHLLG